MRLQKVLNILGQMPKKSQKVVMNAVDFDTMTPSENYLKIIDSMLAISKSASQRELLEVYRDMNPTDEEVLEAFRGKNADALTPLFFNEDQVDFIRENVYRNRDGDFRLIPKVKHVSAEAMPLDGLKADEDIIAARLRVVRVSPNGSQEEFDGLEELRKQPYDGPYDGVFKTLEANLRRVNIISSFAKDEPHGFFRKNNEMYRNICSNISTVDQSKVNDLSFRRAMFLMYLVSGAKLSDWKALYTLVHFMVRVPNSATGYILYLNDFDAGGNGKSKFISLLDKMFGDAFTAFSVQQLRFTISLLGKRLVSISEYEENENAKPLQAILKSMTGRDRFQYEGKGVDPIVAETYQNFVISSNRYIYFDDSGIKRRLQNFHCSNLLHLILDRTKTQNYLNKLFGNIYTGESLNVLSQMSNTLLDYIEKDNTTYDIPIRPQSVVLGSLKNPILRALFSPRVNFDGFIDEVGGKAKLQIWRLSPEAKPEQLNYAASTIQSWLPELKFSASRDNTVLTCDEDAAWTTAVIKKRLNDLDSRSSDLRAKSKVRLEVGEFCGLNSKDLFEEFLGETCRAYEIPVVHGADFIEVGE